MPKVAKPRKKGNRWEINYLDAEGRRRWKTYATHREAVAGLRQLQSEADEIASGQRPALPPEKTFAELLTLCEQVKHAKRSLSDDISRARHHLTPTFGGMKLTEISVAHIARLERRLSQRLQVNTVRQILALLRAMLKLAVEHGWLVVAPRVVLPRAPELDYEWIRSEEAMGRLLKVAEEEDYPGLMQFYATALYTGMRAGELCGLRWEDVDLERRLITVKRSYDTPTKNNRIRRVPILDPLLPVLSAWKPLCPAAEFVFPNLAGNMQVSHSRVTKQTFQRCREKAKIPRITFHALRHTFASHWILKGGDLFRLQRILGHRSIEMTQRYAHLAPDAFKQDLGRFGDFVPKSGGEE
ncbi:MAG: site-specific integrase [Pseudomonadota bacterium]